MIIQNEFNLYPSKQHAILKAYSFGIDALASDERQNLETVIAALKDLIHA
ncbi:hypothetical protein [Kingella potus]|nr:hypothetical protein [Kingella potus]UOP00328.1 hypothetical protein LVJ84_10530 [Kingella potus]